jgi:hypothetical protein
MRSHHEGLSATPILVAGGLFLLQLIRIKIKGSK